MSHTERRRVLYYGRVQGVGFRYTAQRLAGRFAVTGFVRNLPAGNVELVAEGVPLEIERFLSAVREQMSDGIQSEQAATSDATGEFRGFEIHR
ncbi:MAG: acylphosphatase [Pirellulales bacterium]|nr:acylphosphatase [Pirellulales bacterium]